jgi:small subunit ribosomal protein S17
MMQPSRVRRPRKTKLGRVAGNAMRKTIVVETEVVTAHPMYGKRLRRTRRFLAHDEHNEARVGDLVRIAETRPLSARKRWRLVEIVERAR